MVEPERRQTSIGIDKETLSKLRTISERSRLTETEIVTDFINALSKLIEEGIEASSRISLGSFVDLKSGSVRTCVAPIFFGLSELPFELQKDVLKAFGYERQPNGFLKDTREKKVTKK